MKNLITFFVNFLYPIRCSFCNIIIHKNSKYFLCDDCIKKIKFIDENSCIMCGKELFVGYKRLCADCRLVKHSFDKACSVVEYSGEIKKALINYKFFEKRTIQNTFIKLLLDKITVFNNIDMVIPVPLHAKRMRQRGFNQSESLAKEIASELKCEYDNKSLIRIKDTISQSKLNRLKRLKNLKNVFKVLNYDIINSKDILLIDDIYTTGTTVSECAKALKFSGANKVYVLTIASGKGY